jgi:hypothetical protein
MPQFDFYSFSTQVFYVLLGFVIFHFFILNFVVVSSSQVLKLRQKLFNTYLLNTLSSLKSNKTFYDSNIFCFFNTAIYSQITFLKNNHDKE